MLDSPPSFGESGLGLNIENTNTINELDNVNTESTTIVPNDGVTENLTPENIALHFSERKDDELEPEKKK